nr:unnamed protein product [Callosobruchus chinensis]
MKGVVNRKSKDHVGLLVYNALNVSILKPKDNEEWIGGYVELGAEVLFRITYISLTSFMPYIRGEIMSIFTFRSILTDVNSLSKGETQKSKKRKKDASTEGTLNSKRRKVDHSVSDEPKLEPKKKKKPKSLSNDIDQSLSDLANNNSSKKKTKHLEDNSSLQNSTGYTTFEENLLESIGSTEETPVREKKAKKDKSNKKGSYSENTVIAPITERRKMFSSIESPMLKLVEDDSMTLSLGNGDSSSILELDGLTEETRTKAKKGKHKNNGLLENNNSLGSLDDTQTKQKVDEGNMKTKKTRGKKLSTTVETCTFNIPIKVKQESGNTVEQGGKKSKKHKDKNHEADE